MLMHVDPQDHYPYEGDITNYICIGGKTTPEKSTWDISKVTCKNCLQKLKTILHKKDWKGRIPVIYNGQLWEESPVGLFAELELCRDCDDILCIPLVGLNLHINCPYEKLMHKMYNGMKDCPECGGEKELIKTITYFPNFSFDILFGLHSLFPTFIKIYRCKLCGYTW